MDARPGGPTAKRQPSPEGLGNRSEEDPSAVGAALNRCVIRSEAEGSTVQSFGCNEFVIPTGEIMGLRPISANLRGSFSSNSHKIVILRACDFFDLSCFSDNEPDVS